MSQKRATIKLYKRRIEPLSQVGPLRLGGTLFHVKESDGVFQVAFDDANFNDVEVGIQFKEGPDFEPFKNIFLKNETASPINVEFYIGDGRNVIDARLNTLVDRTVNIDVSQKNALTYSFGYSQVISGGADVFSGVADGGRKSFSIFNREAVGSGNNISVLAGNGVEMHLVEPRQSYVVETGGQISITGGAFAYSVCEVFYVA